MLTELLALSIQLLCRVEFGCILYSLHPKYQWVTHSHNPLFGAKHYTLYQKNQTAQATFAFSSQTFLFYNNNNPSSARYPSAKTINTLTNLILKMVNAIIYCRNQREFLFLSTVRKTQTYLWDKLLRIKTMHVFLIDALIQCFKKTPQTARYLT